MDTTAVITRFGLALVIGVLVGLQREYAYQESRRELFAGARTLALIGLIGCASALLADLATLPWVFIMAFFAVGGLIAISYFITGSAGDIGLTSEMAALLVFLIGGLCYWGHLEIAAALGVGTAVLLSLKVGVRKFVGRITEQDVLATLKFLVITAIVLPLLPNRTFGSAPFDVLNPQNVWLMVVFISAISFVGYVLIKLVGTRRGIGLTGLLGGLVSSTAVTLSFTQQSRTHTSLARPFALAITVSWTMMFARVLIEAAVLSSELLARLWLPMIGAGGMGLVYCGVLLFFTREHASAEDVTLKAPFELGPALRFAAAYAIILVFSRGAQMLLGDPGVYVSAAASGIADVDAITLSLARMTEAGTVGAGTASKAIVLAAMVNTSVKGGIVLALGAPSLRKSILPALALILIAGLGLAYLA
ncbi:MAG: MgtC/SapB family protein [Candidatus Atribacteria bacterium]|nr:MAG: MgtC/SapB family protein [Candidatus Atribacteria bacterium]